MAVGQRQRLYSGVRIFTGNYLSSTPMPLRFPGAELEFCSLAYQQAPRFLRGVQVQVSSTWADPDARRWMCAGRHLRFKSSVRNGVVIIIFYDIRVI
jgi:hypothetical protein